MSLTLVGSPQGLQKKCEEKGWLKDVDGMLGYFKKVSTSRDPDKQCFCMNSRNEPDDTAETFVQLASFVPIVRARESNEGMACSIASPIAKKEEKSPRRADESKGTLPAFAARRKAQQRTEQRTWTTIGTNPFRETIVSNHGSMTKVGSLSFDSSSSRQSQQSVRIPKDDSLLDPEKHESHIHLLEIETDVESSEEENHYGSRFEC